MLHDEERISGSIPSNQEHSRGGASGPWGELKAAEKDGSENATSASSTGACATLNSVIRSDGVRGMARLIATVPAEAKRAFERHCTWAGKKPQRSRGSCSGSWHHRTLEQSRREWLGNDDTEEFAPNDTL